MSLTETEKRSVVLSASDLLRQDSLSCEFECKVILETRICYFISYLIMTPIIFLIAFFNRSCKDGKIGIMKFRDDERNCTIHL